MAGYHLCTLLRQDPNSLLFYQVGAPGTLVCDIQDGGADAPPVSGETYILQGNPFSKHKVFCYAANRNKMPPPDIQTGDAIIDEQDLDDATGQPSAYVCLYVNEWSWHTEVDGRKPVRAPNIVAVNTQILAAYNQTVSWLQKITERTPGARPGPGYDPMRQQETVQTDGTFGVGWQTASQNGYLAPVTIAVGINEAVKIETFEPQGLTIYTGPLVQWMPPVVLTKGDVLILSSSRRFRVGDEITPIQVYGTSVLMQAKLEEPDSTDSIYTIPVSQSSASLNVPVPWFGN